MQAWAGFYTAVAAAAAAMLGLLFVAVSVNAATLEDLPSRRLTEQAFQNYLAVLMVSLLALFPDMTVPTFGFVTLLATAGWAVWVLVRFYQTLTMRRDAASWRHSVRRHISSLCGFAMMLVSAARMALHEGKAFDWFAASTLVLLFSATTVAWEMLRALAERKAA